MSSDVAKALRQWHRLQAAEARDMFPSRLTRKGGPPLSARQIRSRLTRYLTIAGIPKVYSPHSLWQPFATKLLNAGASLEGNADTEGVMRTLWLNEWTSSFELSRALETWITDYNEHYLHSSLGYRTPRQCELEYQCCHRSPFVAA
jgi:transposase InsO family protein